MIKTEVNEASNLSLMAFISFGVLLIICACPEVCLAAGLEGQLDKVGTLASGKVKTIGITTATIGGSIWSIFKGNLKLMGVIMAIGVCISLYLEWVAGGMKFAA